MDWVNKEIMLQGTGTSDGIGIGRAVPVVNALPVVKKEIISDVDREIRRLKEAQDICAKEIELLAQETEVRAGRQVAAIVRSHAALLGDPSLNREIRGLMESELCCCEWAVESVCSRYRALFEQMEDEMMRQRAADLEDIRIRLLQALSGSGSRELSLLPEGSIIVARELTPSMTASMDAGKITGILTEAGGSSSHASILARALEIPAVTGVTGIMELVKMGMNLIVDGSAGTVYVEPGEDRRRELEEKREESLREKQALQEYRNRPAMTADGETVTLYINMERPGDAALMKQVGACGVGLFRTEFLFMNRETAPGEEEQFRIYRSVARSLGGRPLTIRTMDIGGDKSTSCIRIPKEDNPFLGYRAIRICLDRREELFLPQIRAILRAGAYGNVRIMLPMISTVEEFLEGKRLIREAEQDLKSKGIPHAEGILVGMMAETPAAVIMADAFAREADFFSIGTNDLIQYTMAVDRGNELVAPLYSPFHPAVLRSIRRVIEAGKAAGIPVGMCGEAAADTRLIPFLLSMGMRELSMAPSQILKVKEAVAGMDLEKLREGSRRMLEASTEKEVYDIMGECW